MGLRLQAEDLKNELLRVRRELSLVDTQLASTARDLTLATECGDRARMEDARNVRQSLWRDKEQLRVQETIFLKLLFDPGSHVPTVPPVDPASSTQVFPQFTDCEWFLIHLVQFDGELEPHCVSSCMQIMRPPCHCMVASATNCCHHHCLAPHHHPR